LDYEFRNILRYEGNLVVEERDLNNLPTIVKDLSGSIEGAGGIGFARPDTQCDFN